jgi:anti-repressor protein
MSAVEVFQFPATGQRVRTVVDGGEPWFVLNDVGSVLDLANVHSSAALLDEDERGIHTVEAPGGDAYPVAIISEAGLYSLILRSRKPEAKAFKRWVTHEVLPTIRRTGRYEVARHQLPQSFAEALQLAADQARQIEQQREQLAVAAPAAEAWNTLASGDGDYSVADAAKILSRDPAISVGERRLFTVLSEHGWIYRQRGDGRWRVYQAAVEAGRMSELPSSHYHPRTGELVVDAPKVRVTVKGLAALHKLLDGQAPPRLSEQLQLTT